MATIDLKQLVGRLNEVCRRALEAAAGMTLSRTHYNVEIEHWLLALADRADCDVAAILRQYEIDQGRFVTDLNHALEKLKTGNSRAPALAPDIVDLGKQAWLLGSLEQGATRVRSGHLLWALIADETLARRAREASSQLLKINADALKRDFATITANRPRLRKRRLRPPQVKRLVATVRRWRRVDRARWINSPPISQRRRGQGRSIRSLAATARSARSSISSRGDGRTTRSSPVRPVWERRRWWKASRCVSHPVTCHRRCKA